MKLKKPKFWDYKKVSFWSIMLLPIAFVYQFIFWLIKIFKPLKKLSIPVICVGNIYIGGTGKTPLAREIFNITKILKKNPAFVKKPYFYLNDEIKMLKKTGKTFTSKDRLKSVELSITDNHDIVILDDGFQDFSIKPDLSIICFNSNQLIGNGFTIPSGPLRENLSSLKRADCIFINGDKNLNFEKKLRNINSNIKIFYSKYQIKHIEKFKNKEVVAFAGIGNPQNFFQLLKENGINLIKTFSFPDHHNYSQFDYDNLINEIEYKQNLIIVTTEKDYCRIDEINKKKFDYVEVNLKIENKDEFINLIKSKI